MNSEDLDDVLRRVAAGELSPQDALAALETGGDAPGAPGARGSLDAPPPAWPDEPDEPDDLDEPLHVPDSAADDAGAAPVDEAPAEPDVTDGDGEEDADTDAPVDLGKVAPPGGLRVVRLRMPARAIDVYADPAVAEVHVSGGAPVLRRQADALVVEPASRPFAPGVRFAFTGGLPRRLASAVPLLDERVVVRINPALRLEVDATAVSLRVWGCEGGLRLRLAASSCKLSRVSGPVDLDVMSSSVKGSVRLTGRNHIRCESSSVKLSLLAGSDVRIQARNRMGKVVVPRRTSRAWLGEDERAAGAVGRGRGRLTVDATMSSVQIGAS